MENPISVQKPERLWTKDYIIVMLASFGTAFCNYIFFTALPLYAQKVSGSEFYSGLMLTVYSFAALLARPFSGIFSDKFGRVRLLIIGAFICAVACALYGITTAIILLLAIRVINGFGFGMHSTCAGAVAADVIPKSRMSEGIGYFGLYATFAAAFAPFIALTVVGKGEIRDFQQLFFIAAALCLASMIFDCCITYERKRKKALRETALQGGQSKTAAGPAAEEAAAKPAAPLPKTFLGFEYAVFQPMAVLILLFFAQSSINTFLTLFAEARALGNIGLYFTINAVGLFASRVLFGRLTDRLGPDIVVIPGIIGIVVCLAAIPFVHTPLLLYIIAAPMGLASGAVYPAINSMIFLRCSPQRRGTASAAYFAAIDIGFMIGGLVFGAVADTLGYSVVYWAAAVLTALALGLYLKAVAVKKPARANI
ncbi:MFS transporter [Sporobacter termitidis]|nr:MFS transporter [Sporobacter termitidis]